MKVTKRQFLLQVLAVPLLSAVPLGQTAFAAPDEKVDAKTLQSWGLETLQQTEKDMLLPERGLYADSAQIKDGKFEKGGPAFNWGVGVQLSAMIKASQLDTKWLAPTLKFADAVEIYWNNPFGLGGYDVLPAPKGLDRYYDDNAWVLLDQIELYELTKEPRFLQRAQHTIGFIQSGADDKLGGGIYWKENGRDSKNTCSNAPSIVGALRLYQLTGDAKYRQSAESWYKWTNEKLQDPADGLYWDNIKINGEVGKAKFSYNSALMIRANCVMSDITKDPKYLQEAQRIGRACQEKWVDKNSGALNDTGRFAHLLIGSLLAIYERDNDPRWMKTATDALRNLHEKDRDPNGRYPENWGKGVSKPLEKWGLIDQGSAARGFLETAYVMKTKR